MYDLVNIKHIIAEIIENRGIEYTEDDTLLNIDSLQFISMVIELEEILDITISDDYLVLDSFSSFTNIENMITDILQNSVSEK